MRRKDVLVLLRIAGYHGDQRLWMRTYVENRVSIAVANREWQRGADMKLAAVACVCSECAKVDQRCPAARP